MKQIRLLIVDDVAEVRRDLRTALTLAGNIEVVGEAANGLEAIRLAQALPVDVILMDLEMPYLNGYEATRRIKEWHPAMHIIGLTIHGYESARRRAAEAGMDDFVVKGTPLESLIQIIAKQKE